MAWVSWATARDQSRDAGAGAGGITFVTVSSGSYNTCGLTSEGVAYCWGYNYYGAIGDGTATDRLTPVRVLGGLAFTSVVPVERTPAG